LKIAILNDTHCGIRNSSDIFIKYQETFYNDVFWPYIEKNEIKHILHLGDYYDHRKFINFKALNSNRKVFLQKLRDNGITMDIIPGNHDTFYKNTNDLNSLKELLGHWTDEVNIIMEPTVMNYGSLKMGLIPWICEENYNTCMDFINTCSADWIGAHLELSDFEVLRGVTHHGGMNRSIFKRFEMVLTGHFHVGSHQDNIKYLGSQMEFFWGDAHDPKYFHVLDTETREVTPVKNELRLFERIIYDDSKTDYTDYDVSVCANKFIKVVVKNKSNLFIFDRFIDRIQNENIHELKIQENFSEFMGDNVIDGEVSIEDTSSMLDEYIDNTETDLDKTLIKLNMRELMKEAQAEEIT
jgi:DNA repair exonuclease SbcCD nuclease subunit|tara:strand:- start:64 stop:1125 length:1062 start_codon:yes stop_codon:yes gene_type:complete